MSEAFANLLATLWKRFSSIPSRLALFKSEINHQLVLLTSFFLFVRRDRGGGREKNSKRVLNHEITKNKNYFFIFSSLQLGKASEQYRVVNREDISSMEKYQIDECSSTKKLHETLQIITKISNNDSKLAQQPKNTLDRFFHHFETLSINVISFSNGVLRKAIYFFNALHFRSIKSNFNDSNSRYATSRDVRRR